MSELGFGRINSMFWILEDYLILNLTNPKNPPKSLFRQKVKCEKFYLLI